jgi:hypothetical protein
MMIPRAVERRLFRRLQVRIYQRWQSVWILRYLGARFQRAQLNGLARAAQGFLRSVDPAAMTPK